MSALSTPSCGRPLAVSSIFTATTRFLLGLPPVNGLIAGGGGGVGVAEVDAEVDGVGGSDTFFAWCPPPQAARVRTTDPTQPAVAARVIAARENTVITTSCRFEHFGRSGAAAATLVCGVAEAHQRRNAGHRLGPRRVHRVGLAGAVTASRPAVGDRGCPARRRLHERSSPGETDRDTQQKHSLGIAEL